jgi:hypothetical protein
LDTQTSAIEDGVFSEIHWDQSRSTIWLLGKFDQKLYGCTRNKKLQLNAWHRHELGGIYSATTNPLPRVKSICVTPPNSQSTTTPYYLYSSGYDIVWMAVQRTINGSSVVFIERMIHGPTKADTALTSSVGEYWVDAAEVVTVTDEPTEITGLTHLIGETVRGHCATPKGLFAVPAKVVGATGAFDLNTSQYSNDAVDIGAGSHIYTSFTFGLMYNSIIEPLRVEAGSQIGSAQGAIKRIHMALIRFYKTIGCKFGRDADNLETLLFRDASTPLNQSAALFTGDKKVYLDSTYDRDAYLYIIQDNPLPMTVVSIISEGMTYD